MLKKLLPVMYVLVAIGGLILIAAALDLRGAPLPDPPIHEAAFEGNNREVERLLDSGVPVDSLNENRETALFRACQSKSRPTIELLLKRGANLDAIDNRGETVLLRAVRAGDVPLSTFLISKGAATIFTSEDTLTKVTSPLQESAGQGNDQMVEILLSAGLSPVQKDNSGMSALDWARRSQRTSTIALLVKSRQGRGARSD